MTICTDVFGGEAREEGRKERSLDFTRRHAHMERAVCKCVQSDREHFAARCSCAYPAFSRASSSLLSLVLRASRGFSPEQRDTQMHTPKKDRRRHRVATPSTTSSRSLMYIQRPVGRSIGRSISRSPGIISPEVAGSEQSRVSLRRMNKILFSFHAAQRTRLNAAEEFRKWGEVRYKTSIAIR